MNGPVNGPVNEPQFLRSWPVLVLTVSHGSLQVSIATCFLLTLLVTLRTVPIHESRVNNLLLSFNAATLLHFHHIGLFYCFHLLRRHRFHRPVQYRIILPPCRPSSASFSIGSPSSSPSFRISIPLLPQHPSLSHSCHVFPQFLSVPTQFPHLNCRCFNSLC